MGLFGKKEKDKGKEKETVVSTSTTAYKPPKEFCGTPEQMAWLSENVLRKAGVKKIVYENADQIYEYIKKNYEEPLRQKSKGKTNSEINFLSTLLSALAFFTDSQEIF